MRTGIIGEVTVWSLSHLRCQEAGLIAGEQGCHIRDAAVAEVVLAVVGGQDRTKRTSLEPTLLASLFDNGLAPGKVASMNALGLQLLSAVSKRGSLDGLQVFAALSGFLSNIVTRMSSDESCKQDKPGSNLVEQHGGMRVFGMGKNEVVSVLARPSARGKPWPTCLVYILR